MTAQFYEADRRPLRGIHPDRIPAMCDADNAPQLNLATPGQLWARLAEGRIRGENYPAALAEQRADNRAAYGIDELDVEYEVRRRGYAKRGPVWALPKSGVIRAGVRVK